MLQRSRICYNLKQFLWKVNFSRNITLEIETYVFADLKTAVI